jgi:hypothetical protein
MLYAQTPSIYVLSSEQGTKFHRLKIFVNRMSRRVFGLKEDGVTEGQRKIHNEDPNNLYSSLNIS